MTLKPLFAHSSGRSYERLKLQARNIEDHNIKGCVDIEYVFEEMEAQSEALAERLKQIQNKIDREKEKMEGLAALEDQWMVRLEKALYPKPEYTQITTDDVSTVAFTEINNTLLVAIASHHVIKVWYMRYINFRL